MNINSLLMIASIVIFLSIIVALWVKAKGQSTKVDVEVFNTIDKVLEAVKNEMVEIVKDDISLGISNEEFDRLFKRKARINEALKNCVHGIDSSKALVIDLIRNFISNRVPIDQVTALLGLDAEGEPSNQVKFEIIMYRYKKQYKKDALKKWIDGYNFNRQRRATDSTRPQDMAYYITEDDLRYSYAKEDIHLDPDEQIDILAVLVYQQYKGFGIVDTVREMNIDGLNMGTSGSILQATQKNQSYKANNAVWIYDRGRYIHLRFLNFGTEDELRRIIQLIIRWNNPGPLTSKRGYLVNTMYDKSRVLALRPPASEYWAVFIRKFTLSDASPEFLIIKEYTHRGDIAINLLEFLLRGQVTCAVTGRQGSGKTTMMSALIRFIDPRHTIRVLEMAPELYLRELYPTRNILSVQETTTVSAADLQDALKKSDAAVSIVGEVATDKVAARMIQLGMTASLFTIFSHHANTPKDLVLTLRNSLVNDGGFSNMETAEKQVTDVVHIDVHLDYTPDGKRYIDKISEIVQLEEGIPYPEYDENDPVNSMNKINAEYYRRTTDRVGFTTRTILKYDLLTDTYVPQERFSEKLESKMRDTLGKELTVNFDSFMLREWGPREGTKEAELSDEEFQGLLGGLEEEVMEISKKYDGIEADTVQKIEEAPKTGKQIEEEAKEKALWAEAYVNPQPAEEEDHEFELGLFDDSDYN